MNLTSLIIIIVGVSGVTGLILGPVFSRSNRKRKIQTQFVTKYDHTVEILGAEKKTQTALEERQQRVKNFDIRHLSVAKSEKLMLSIKCENLLRNLQCPQ